MSLFIRFYGLALAICMLTFGTMNTVFTKYQNMQSFECPDESNPYQCEKCPEEPEPEVCHDFEQPVYQTFTMFLGEFLCFFVFYITLFFQKRAAQKEGIVIAESKLTGWRKLVFVVPTLCDMTATTLMNLGLIYTHASVYQMLRGAVVIFTGLFSVFFLKRKQYSFHWIGMILVVCGIVVVGLASVIFVGEDVPAAKNPLLGDILIIVAQIFTAFQFVFEEKYLSKYEVPALQAVGFEGLYGVFFLVILMPIFQAAIGRGDFAGFFDVRFAFEAFLKFPSISVSTVGSVLSIAFFNYFGLTITKVLSATARSTIDACRTLSVWAVGLIIGWEVFTNESWVQVAGFLVLVLGTFTYNKVVKYPCLKYDQISVEEESKPLNAPVGDGNETDEEGRSNNNGVNYSSIN